MSPFKIREKPHRSTQLGSETRITLAASKPEWLGKPRFSVCWSEKPQGLFHRISGLFDPEARDRRSIWEERADGFCGTELKRYFPKSNQTCRKSSFGSFDTMVYSKSDWSAKESFGYQMFDILFDLESAELPFLDFRLGKQRWALLAGRWSSNPSCWFWTKPRKRMMSFQRRLSKIPLQQSCERSNIPDLCESLCGRRAGGVEQWWSWVISLILEWNSQLKLVRIVGWNCKSQGSY